MKEFVIPQSQAGRRIDKWLQHEAPLLSVGLMQKYFRQKDIKINGKHVPKDTILSAGDVVRLYIPDEYLEKPKKHDSFLAGFRWRLNIVYEDEHILLADKPYGMMVHPDDSEKVNTLVTHVKAYLYQKGEFDSRNPESFAPVPCNRIDRFTGGVVLFAKTQAAMRILNQKIRDREIEKDYLCIVSGCMEPGEGMLENYIFRNERRVTVYDKPTPGAQQAQTRYRTLQIRGPLSLVECDLLTGRTHQIRAQFAHAGHPLLGDNQYGDRRLNERYGREYQALYAYQIVFTFETDAGILNYLKGRAFSAKNVDFVRDYFEDWQ